MRRQSLKTAAIYRRFKKPRRDFIDEMGACAVCRCLATCVDEILRGKNRMRAFQERACWLAACSSCNTGPLADPGEWPVEKKLALKILRDPWWFDLGVINDIYGSERYAAEDVLRFVAYLRAEGIA